MLKIQIMRVIGFSLIVFYSITHCPAEAQLPFPETGKWIFGDGGMSFTGSPTVRTVTGMEVINGFSYYVLQADGSCPVQDHEEEIVHIREDNHRWWVLMPDGSEFLWCDFNLGLGDTLQHVHPDYAYYSEDGDTTEPYQVYEISTITTPDGVNRQYWKLMPIALDPIENSADNYTMHWIEGIGADTYFKTVNPPYVFDLGWYILHCFGADGNAPYPAGPFGSACCWTGNLNETETTSLTVFPNPATDFLQIITPLHMPGQASLSDCSGSTVFTTRIRQSPFTANLTGLSAGMYILTFRSDSGKTWTRPVLKH